MAEVAKIKGYEERKATLIDAAWSLFTKLGYDGTPVNAIIKKLGISKGTFYHYFKSKEDILDAAVERITKHVLDKVKTLVNVDGLPAIRRFNIFMAATGDWKIENIEPLLKLTRVLYRDENSVVRLKMKRRNIAIAVPILEDIILQGIREKVFDNAIHPNETAELVIILANEIAELNTTTLLEMKDPEGCLDKIKHRIELYNLSLEKILGAPKGSIAAISEDFVKSITNFVQKK